MKTLKQSFALLAGTLLLFMFSSTTTFAQKLTDPEIASVAVTANQIDIDYAAIAWKKQVSPEVLNFAKTMRDDHTAVIGMAVKLAGKLGVTPKMNSVTQSLLDGAQKTTKKLNGLSGKEFEKAYVDNEVEYHKAVINAVENVLIPQSTNKELKGLLQKVLPTLKVHLGHAEKLQKSL